MPANTETIIGSPALPTILSYFKLGMPIFQRHFGWGVGHKEQAGLDYFVQFLINTEASDYFGPVSLFTDRRWRYDEDKGIVVWVADAQHRLAVTVMAAWAIMQHLRALEARSGAHDEYRRPKIVGLMQQPELQVLAASSLEVSISFERPSEPLIDFIQQQLARIGSLQAQMDETQVRFSELRAAIRQHDDSPNRRANMAANTQERNRELSLLREEIEEIRKISVVKTFALINNFLIEREGDILTVASDFVNRIRTLQTSLVCLEPRQGYHVDFDAMEATAYSHFSNIAIQSQPMTPGEILGSAIRVQRGRRVGLAGYFGSAPCVEKEAMAFFGLEDKEVLCDYLARMSTGDESIKSFVWVTRKLHSSKNTAKTFDEITEWTDTLVGLYKKVQGMSPAWNSLYTLFFGNMKRAAFAVIATRYAMKAGLDKCDDTFMKGLLRILVLNVIAVLHRTQSNSKFNIMRDAADAKVTGWDEGLSLVKNHFDAPSLDALRAALVECLSTQPLGLNVHRRFGKFLLVLADVNSGGRDVQIPTWANYDYEHVFPQKHSSFASEGLTGEVANSVNEILAMPEFDRTQLINLLGNGALLGKAENISLSNGSPYRKYLAQAEKDKQKYSNAWWPSHLRSLQDTKGVFSAAYIRKRSHDLAKQAVEFLLPGALVDTAPAPATTPALLAGDQLPKINVQFDLAQLSNVVLVAPNSRSRAA